MAKKRRATTREGMVQTSIALPEELHERLIYAAIKEKAAMAVLVREALESWLDMLEDQHAAKERRKSKKRRRKT